MCIGNNIVALGGHMSGVINQKFKLASNKDNSLESIHASFVIINTWHVFTPRVLCEFTINTNTPAWTKFLIDRSYKIKCGMNLSIFINFKIFSNILDCSLVLLTCLLWYQLVCLWFILRAPISIDWYEFTHGHGAWECLLKI